MAAAKEVGDAKVNSLTPNTGIVPQTEGATLSAIENENPWLAMFGTLDLSGQSGGSCCGVQYSQSLGVVHNVVVMAQHGNYGRGITRGMVDAFPMANGLPIYANGAGYHGDKTIADVRRDRDPRLYVMLKEPGTEECAYRQFLR